MHERIREHLARLGLNDEAERMQALLAWAHEDKPDYIVLLERFLAQAAGRRREKRIERRIALSGLTVRKTLEAFEWQFQPKLDRAAIEGLATLEFVNRAEDLVMTGQSGTGKSHILQALALRACQHELRVRYARCVDLLDDLYAGLADGTYPRRLARWSRPTLLVLDDVGLGHVRKRDDEPTAAQMLFNLLDHRHLKASTAISSNIKLSSWGKYLGDVPLAAALLDRLAMSSIRIDIDGPSYRQHLARVRAQRGAAAKPAPEKATKERRKRPSRKTRRGQQS